MSTVIVLSYAIWTVDTLLVNPTDTEEGGGKDRRPPTSILK